MLITVHKIKICFQSQIYTCVHICDLLLYCLHSFLHVITPIPQTRSWVGNQLVRTLNPPMNCPDMDSLGKIHLHLLFTSLHIVLRCRNSESVSSILQVCTIYIYITYIACTLRRIKGRCCRIFYVNGMSMLIR